nr:hypothetical protein [uncultured Carboxylicivirga sp.]
MAEPLATIMKYIITILILLVSLSVSGQPHKIPELINYLSICDENEVFENYNRINNRIAKQDISKNILTLQLDIYGNCSIGDTSWINYSNDTLFIWTGPIEMQINDYVIMIAESECDCYFHLFYDILNLEKTPQTVIFNENVISLTSQKFLPEEYKLINGKEYLIYDSNGVYYEYNFYKNGNIKTIRMEYGLISKVLHYNEKNELIEVYLDTRLLEDGNQKIMKIK